MLLSGRWIQFVLFNTEIWNVNFWLHVIGKIGFDQDFSMQETRAEYKRFCRIKVEHYHHIQKNQIQTTPVTTIMCYSCATCFPQSCCCHVSQWITVLLFPLQQYFWNMSQRNSGIDPAPHLMLSRDTGLQSEFSVTSLYGRQNDDASSMFKRIDKSQD